MSNPMNSPVLTDNKRPATRTTLRVLLVEDSETDAQLILMLLRKGGMSRFFSGSKPLRK